MDVYVNSVARYLFAQSWQIALLVVIAGLISLALRNRSAHIRYLLWLIVLAKCLVPPMYSVSIAVLPERSAIEHMTHAALPLTPIEKSVATGAGESVTIEKAPDTSQKQLTLPNAIETTILVWLTGMFLFLLWVGSRAVRYHLWLHRRRTSVPSTLAQEFQELFVNFKFRKSPRIWLAGDIAQPFVWGLFHGSVYLPADFAGLDRPQHHRTVLVHELSHIARFDAAVNLLQILAQAIFWFHPFVWWSNKKIRQEREKCCDEMAVAQLSTPPEHYTDAIVEALAAERRSAHPVPSLAIVGSVKDIEERIKIMLRPGKKFYKHPSVRAIVVLLMVAILTIPVGYGLTRRARAETASEPQEKPSKSLHKAVSDGDNHQIKLLIAQGADVNAKEGREDTPLHIAAQESTVETANLLILKGADVNVKNKYGFTPVSRALLSEGGGRRMVEFLVSKGAKVSALHLAAHRGDIDKVRSSLEEGTNVDVRDEAGHTPLFYAASTGQLHVVKFLISKSAQVDAKDNRGGQTPLCYAGNAGWRNVTELLIAKGADVNAKVRWGYRTPLSYAVKEGHKEVAELLIDKGADVNGRTLLSSAVKEGHKEIAELLIDKGADVNTKTWKRPLLYWAVWGDENREGWDMTKLLVSKGADVNFVAEDEWTYLQYIACTDDWEVAELLLAHGAKLNAKDSSNRTALHIALSRGHRDMAEFLVSKGAAGPELHLAACLGNLERVKSLVEGGMDVDTTDEAGFTPLYWATSIGREEVAEFLIDKGADIGVEISSNRKLLHRAAQSGSAKLAKLLISKGSEVNVRVRADLTPLHSAARRGHKNIVELLIAAGADVQVRQISGNTPLHNAASAGHVDVVEVLLTHGADVNEKDKPNKRGLTLTALIMARNNGHTEIVELLRKHGAKE